LRLLKEREDKMSEYEDIFCDKCLCSSCSDKVCRELVCFEGEVECPIKNCKGYISKGINE